MIYKNVLDLIGNTPIIKLNNLVDKDSAEVYVKLEKYNLGGSVKDRAALGMIEKAEKEVQLWTANDIDVDKEELGLKGSPTKVKKTMTKETKGAGEVINESPTEAVKYVLGKLKEKHYI